MSDECQHETICSDCGAMTTGYAALTARAEAAEQQAARLRVALEGFVGAVWQRQMSMDGTMREFCRVCQSPREMKPHLAMLNRGRRADGHRDTCHVVPLIDALAASQPAPAAETERRQQGEQEADR